MISRAVFLTAILLFCSLSAGCGDDDDRTLPPGHVSLEGTVQSVEDFVPVDGGVTIELQTDDGTAVTLEMGSLFTVPEPTPQQIALYEVIRQVEEGDRVRAVGVWNGPVLELSDLDILR